MNLKQTFEKQGGVRLLKQYWKGGAAFTAVMEFLLLGRSRTALEILRLSTQLKIKQKLYRRYRDVLENFDTTYEKSLLHENSRYVWVCWFQGMDNAPEMVRKCYESLVRNMPDRQIVLITADNMEKYVSFPKLILDKWNAGSITNTHMTDLLRLELLIKYGGMWVDATVFCSGPDIPDYFFNSDLFFYQCLKPGRDGHANYISSWLITAKTNNRILMAARELCYAYWLENDSMWDYFLLHDFLSIALEKYEDDWKAIVPRDNATPHILLLRLFEEYDETAWTAIRQQTPFHKLSYKLDEADCGKKGTYYDVLFRSHVC